MTGIIGNYKIQISKGDFWRLKIYHYFPSPQKNGSVYFQRQTQLNFRRQTYYLHREIMNTPKGLDCDHRDGNTLNFLHRNLRNCTHMQNMQNVKKRKNNTSGFKGISWDHRRNKWKIQLQGNKKRIMKRYDDFKTAIAVCRKLTKSLHGQFARFD
jgi:hypothetical protein